MYSASIGTRRYVFPDLRTVLARATPFRSGDALAGLAAETGEERVAAQFVLADLPLRRCLDEPVVPYESDEVTRLIVDGHDAAAFAPIAHLTVGGFRDWLLSDDATTDALAAARAGRDAGDGGGGQQALPSPGPDGDRGEVPCGDPLPQHDRPARAAVGAAAAEPSDRRSARHRRQHPRRPAVGGRRRRHRHQSGHRQPAARAGAARACSTTFAPSSASRRRPACSRTSPPRSASSRRGAPVDLVFQSIAGTQAANRSFGVDLAAAEGRRAMRRCRSSAERSATT